MTYATINEKTVAGRRLLAEMRRSKAGSIIHDKPNEATRKALKDAKAKKGVKEMKDTSGWLDKIFSYAER